MSNEFKPMGKDQVTILWSAMGYAFSNEEEFKEEWNISDEQWALFYPLFEELADAALHHQIMR
jgi:hypothetical protein